MNAPLSDRRATTSHVQRLGLSLVMLALTTATAHAADDTRVIADLPYKDAPAITDYERERCKLDLYVPATVKPDAPVLVWFHGGGLTAGDKSSAAPFARRLAAHGIVTAAVNYRLSPNATYPAYNQDAAASVAWVKHHIREYGPDPSRLFVAGHSAGGYLCSIVAYDPSLLAAHNLSPNDIAGIIAVAPQVFTHFTVRKERGIANPETTPVIDPAAPAYHVRKDAPPTLILLGDHDWPVRLEECQYFVSMLRHLGHPDATLHVIPDRTHGSIASKMADESDPGLALALDFIQHHSTTQPATATIRSAAP